MIDIEDKSHKPEIDEIYGYVQNPLFTGLCDYMKEKYAPVFSVEYSGDNVLAGWNLKFKKAGRTLCTVYPRRGFFCLLLVVGRREKEQTEALLPELSEEFRTIYENTKEGMGQRWMVFELRCPSLLYEDILKIIEIRRQSK